MRTNKLLKLRNKFSVNDVYFSKTDWIEKEIDGVKFLPVSKIDPTQVSNPRIHLMRKDSLEKIK
jgi:hypothetical protein